MTPIELREYADWALRFAAKADAAKNPRIAAHMRKAASVAQWRIANP